MKHPPPDDCHLLQEVAFIQFQVAPQTRGSPGTASAFAAKLTTPCDKAEVFAELLPASSGRVRNASTARSTSAAIRETCDLETRVIPRDPTSFSIRRVETPSRYGGHHGGQGSLGALATLQ
jgi:hypothetical protein